MALAWSDDFDDDQDDGVARFAAWSGEGPTLDERLARCRPAWFDRAACRDRPDLDWYSPDDADACRVVCEACPVRARCAEAGRRERFGMWGGNDRATHPPKPQPSSWPPGRRVDYCVDCGEERPVMGHGRCTRCYWRERRSRVPSGHAVVTDA